MCKTEGCSDSLYAKGFCKFHYHQDYRRTHWWGNLNESRQKATEYAREWRSRPENAERQRASSRRARAKRFESDPEGERLRERERYARYMAQPGARERHRERSRRATAEGRWTTRRRGLTKQDRHEYWEYREGLCDFCTLPYPDPAISAHRDVAVDHDREHEQCPSPSVGCVVCVRAQGHRECNVLEGFVKKAVARGLISGYWGRLNDVLSDPPIQKWMRSRVSPAPASSLAVG